MLSVENEEMTSKPTAGSQMQCTKPQRIFQRLTENISDIECFKGIKTLLFSLDFFPVKKQKVTIFTVYLRLWWSPPVLKTEKIKVDCSWETDRWLQEVGHNSFAALSFLWGFIMCSLYCLEYVYSIYILNMYSKYALHILSTHTHELGVMGHAIYSSTQGTEAGQSL